MKTTTPVTSAITYNPLGANTVHTFLSEQGEVFTVTALLTPIVTYSVTNSAYTYNALGNILTSSAGAYSYSGAGFANPHAVTSIVSSVGTTTTTLTTALTYDNNGNLLADGARTFAWDYRNRIGSAVAFVGAGVGSSAGVVSPASTSTIQYAYSAGDTRNYMSTVSVAKVGAITTATTTAVFYPSATYSESAVSTSTAIISSTKTRHIFLFGNSVATVETTQSAVGATSGATITPTTAVTYTYSDHLGSANVVSDSAGNPIETLAYSPYGATSGDIKTPSPLSPATFSEQRTYIGQYADAGTNLSYLNARYYDGSRGTFLSEDPVFWEVGQSKDGKSALTNPQSLNSYSYANGNPIMQSDPSGRFSVSKSVQSILSAISAVVSSFSTKSSSSVSSAPTRSVSPVVQRTTTWDPITNQRIGRLDSRVQQSATNFINDTESSLGIQLRVAESYRTGSQQNLYYARGRNQEQLNAAGLNDVTARPDLQSITNATAGRSYHNYGRAIDVVPVVNGREDWNKPITQEIANVGAQQGFGWGASFGDRPHFEMSLGQSINSLQQTYIYDK